MAIYDFLTISSVTYQKFYMLWLCVYFYVIDKMFFLENMNGIHLLQAL